MAVELLYETHSLTTDNEAGVATGWLPGRLSTEGQRLARELGERHRAEPIAAVFVSDLARAVETAELAFSGTAVPIHRDARLRECNYGELNGMPVAQLAAERARHISLPYPGGQSYEQMVNATANFIPSCQRLAGILQWDRGTEQETRRHGEGGERTNRE